MGEQGLLVLQQMLQQVNQGVVGVTITSDKLRDTRGVDEYMAGESYVAVDTWRMVTLAFTTGGDSSPKALQYLEQLVAGRIAYAIDREELSLAMSGRNVRTFEIRSQWREPEPEAIAPRGTAPVLYRNTYQRESPAEQAAKAYTGLLGAVGPAGRAVGTGWTGPIGISGVAGPVGVTESPWPGAPPPPEPTPVRAADEVRRRMAALDLGDYDDTPDATPDDDGDA